MKEIPRLKIEKLAMGGYGIGYFAGKAIFIPYTAAGDEIKAEITYESKNYAYGRVKEFLVYSAINSSNRAGSISSMPSICVKSTDTLFSTGVSVSV